MPVVTDVLPPYRVRVSQRARNARLEISPRLGLQVVVPVGFQAAEILNLLHAKRHWIAKHWQNMALDQPAELLSLPERIDLKALSECWKVTILPVKGRMQILQRPQHSLVLLGDAKEMIRCRQLLRQWLVHYAKQRLIPWLTQLSEATGLSYHRATIRGQKTRWGSCSHQQTISLNYQLLFLPTHVVNYVLLHELCHTVHLNHSQHFWRLVEYHEPQWRNYRNQLANCHQLIPAWLFASS